MAKIDLDTLSIEELAALREQATEKLAEKVAARQAELEAELEKLAQYGRGVKKPVAPAAKPKHSEPVTKNDTKNDMTKLAEAAAKVAREAA